MAVNPFKRRPRASPEPQRVYAIGDIHGRLDLLVAMIARIQADALARSVVSTRIVVLGDFIDRGPDSARIVELLMRLQAEPNVVVLKGNHEAALVDALAGDFTMLDLWLSHGGLATLRSFGMATEPVDMDDSVQLLRLARERVPPPVRAWLARLPTSTRFGPYYLVHAGVKPGVDLDRQLDESRLWITDEFTGSTRDHGAVIVHGHTVVESGVVIAPNRIGVDTGAYRTGRLSAVGLEGTDIWTLTVEGSPEHARAGTAQ